MLLWQNKKGFAFKLPLIRCPLTEHNLKEHVWSVGHSQSRHKRATYLLSPIKGRVTKPLQFGGFSNSLSTFGGWDLVSDPDNQTGRAMTGKQSGPAGCAAFITCVVITNTFVYYRSE